MLEIYIGFGFSLFVLIIFATSVSQRSLSCKKSSKMDSAINKILNFDLFFEIMKRVSEKFLECVLDL